VKKVVQFVVGVGAKNEEEKRTIEEEKIRVFVP